MVQGMLQVFLLKGQYRFQQRDVAILLVYIQSHNAAYITKLYSVYTVQCTLTAVQLLYFFLLKHID